MFKNQYLLFLLLTINLKYISIKIMYINNLSIFYI